MSSALALTPVLVASRRRRIAWRHIGGTQVVQGVLGDTRIEVEAARVWTITATSVSSGRRLWRIDARSANRATRAVAEGIITTLP